MPRRSSSSRQPLDTSSSPGKKVPVGIKLIAALNVIGIVLALTLVPGVFASAHPLAVPAGLFILVLSGAGLVFTYGLVTLRAWGWFGTVAVQVLNGLADIVTGDLLGLLVSGIIVYYLVKQVDLYLDEPSSSYT